MSWPDPNCNKNHAPGAVYRKWEHTPECVRSAPRTIKKEQRITEINKDVHESRELREIDVVQSARNAGGM